MPQKTLPGGNLPQGDIVPLGNPDQMWRVTPKPSAEEFARDFETYRAIQATIDKCMPDSIMDIKGKPFRKKSYWRAVATAFNVTVEPASDEYFEIGDITTNDYDWGYRINYKASTPSGRVAYGDGTCMASEKRRKDGSMVDATHHNVRGHANTRAINRAVSNLVGFGEVSAEEMPMDAPRNQPNRGATGSNQAPRASSGPWDGELPVTFGKYKPGAKEGGPNGKKWSELSTGYLDWILGPKCTIDTAKDMAGKEIGRRAAVEAQVDKLNAAKGDVVDAEEVPLPLDTPDGVEDPRLNDDDGYQPYTRGSRDQE